jgi:hypothetical protein
MQRQERHEDSQELFETHFRKKQYQTEKGRDRNISKWLEQKHESESDATYEQPENPSFPNPFCHR